MAEVDSFQNLLAARMLLKTSLEKSRSVASALEKTGPRLEEIKQSLPSLEAALRAQKCSLDALGGHISRAVGPATAVLKVFDAIHGLEKSLSSDPSSDLYGYLVVVKRLEEALRFLAENCGLAIRWLEDLVEFLKENAVIDDHRYLSNVTKSLKILRELQANEEGARLNGGLLSAAYDKLETEYRRLLRENGVPLPIISSASSIVAPSSLPVFVIQKLQVIIERLSANNRLESCLSTYIDIRSSNARACLEALGLDYLEISIFEFDNLQYMESSLDMWSKHLEYSVKNLLELEYQLCNDVFEKVGLDVSMDCFAKIAIQSGFLAFIQFGNTVTESKKDAVKLFKLLKIFHTLNELRLDFNRLFGGKSCNEIQIPTRQLIKRVIDGACEIFWELLPQVEVHRGTSPPSNGSVPSLVSFVIDYCNQLLQDDYRLTMIQVLEIHQNWKHQKFQEELLRKEVCNIVEAIRLNLDAWSKSYEDTPLSYIFLMNNHCHLYKALKGTSLGDLIGDFQLREHKKYRDYYASIYLRDSWGMLPGLLGHEDETLFSDGRAMACSLVKKKLKTFNEALDGTYKKQSNWVLANKNLRKRICQLVVDAIVPVYRSYIQKYGHFIEQDGIKNVKIYTEEGLVNMMSSMFQPKMGKCYSTNTRHSIDKKSEIVTSQFPSTTVVA
ncbi:exocyst complex component EXO70A1-like [Vitis riparia]|uniref:exocyst complex component EXO70A1-like n=1 Tax=Vitis riparia TaxID=96939 RepID=UPI00155AFF95|nr:exocyst complex component EXO70A1-like [Vitis riparia]